jgi:hypothetical protein
MTQPAPEPAQNAAAEAPTADTPADQPQTPRRQGGPSVGEAIKYRRRAQQAEQRLQKTEQQLTELQAELADRTEQLAASEARRDESAAALEKTRRRTHVERRFHAAGVCDLEAAVALLASRVNLGEDLEPDQLDGAVDRLLVDKPFLLSPPPGLGEPTASARVNPGGPIARTARAAARAAATGDRRDVVEYLRLRRENARP